jgi:PPIC-type PPIASE domain
MQLKSLLREPLLHFLAIGAAIFLVFHFSGGGSAGPGSTRIVIGAGQVAHLEAGFTRTWSRPPTEAELKGLIDEWVREEIAVREAMSAGLDRDDTVIRRRLRQKFEFLVEDAAEAVPPTEDELKAWFAQHADEYRIEPRLAFRQVFVSRDRRGAAAEADAAAILKRLAAAGPEARTDSLGDATMLPADLELAPRRDIDRTFGTGFAKQLDAIEPGTWSGPIRSGYGLHLVLVRERVEGGLPAFEAVRPIALREVVAERRKRQLAALYDSLLQKYTVVLERPAAPEAPASGAASGKGGS